MTLPCLMGAPSGPRKLSALLQLDAGRRWVGQGPENKSTSNFPFTTGGMFLTSVFIGSPTGAN